MGLPWDDGPGLAAAAHSPARSGRHRVLVQCPAGRSPAEDRESTRRGGARASGTACAGRGAASLPRSDEPTHAREEAARSWTGRPGAYTGTGAYLDGNPQI